MNNTQKKTLSIYIYNVIEDEWGFISSFEKRKHKKLIYSSHRFADCYLFANALLPSFTLISPITINPDVVQYFEELSGSHCRVLVPKQKTPFICENMILDKKAFSTLVSEAKKIGSLTMYVYSMTSHVFALKKKFEKAGVTVFLPEGMQEKDLWTVAHFGSKSGFRKSFSPLMPMGSIESDPDKVVQNAVKLFSSSKYGIVLKTDKGNAGQGVHILRKSKIITVEKLKLELRKIFKKEPHLKKHLIILETYINTRNEKKCPFPSIECFIHQNGRIEIPYYCNMIVTPSGEFYGMEMHKNVFTGSLKKKVLDITMKIAKTYRSAGYRGRFDIDMVYDGKQVYAGESNTRTNGGTDTYIIVKKLVGNNVFSDRYVLSSYISLPKKVQATFRAVKEHLKSYLFDKKNKTGLIINSESVIKGGGLTYILVGKNKRQTLLMRHRVKLRLKKLKNP
jgi:hypothetical protein